MPETREPATIIIPAYDEEAGIGPVIADIKSTLAAADVPHEVLVVDDGSTDATAEAAARAGARVVRHIKNRGYGASLKTGIRLARHEHIVIADADGTYPARFIPDLLDALPEADMVVGARTGENVNIPLIRRVPKWVLRKLAGYVTGERIPDLNSGLRAFHRSCIIQYLSILSDRFSFTTTSTVAMLSDHYRVVFMPIDYLPRVGKSKIVPWDFINFLSIVIRLSMLFSPLRVFVPLAGVFFLGGLAKFVLDVWFSIERAGGLNIDVLRQPTVSTSTLILTLAGLQVLLIGMISDGLIRKIAQRVPTTYQSHEVVSVEQPPLTGSGGTEHESPNGAAQSREANLER